MGFASNGVDELLENRKFCASPNVRKTWKCGSSWGMQEPPGGS